MGDTIKDPMDPMLDRILSFLRGCADNGSTAVDLDNAVRGLDTDLGTFLYGVQDLKDEGFVKYYFVDSTFSQMDFELA